MRALARAISCALTVEATVLLVALLAVVGCRAFGYECYDILTDSMAPAMPAGTLVWVEVGADPEAIREGEVVAYRTASGASVTHRVVSNDPESRVIVAKGDRNDVADAPIPYDSVIGRSKACLPGVGALVNSLVARKGEVLVVVLCANAALLAVFEFARRISRKRAGGDRGDAVAEGYGSDEEGTEHGREHRDGAGS